MAHSRTKLKLLPGADLTPERQLELIKLARREIASLAELLFAVLDMAQKAEKRLAELETKVDGMK